MRDNAPTPPLTAALTAVALAGSVFVQPKIPYLGIGWSNIFVPAAGIGLMIVHREVLVPTFKRYRVLFLLLAALLLWGLTSSLAGWDPVYSLRWLAKACGWALVFVGAAVAGRDDAHAKVILQTVWLFVALLALGGVFEFAFPDHQLWRFFRTEHSLTIQPRIASVLSWPNQFGLIMAAGFFLNEYLSASGKINRFAAAVTGALMLTQLAQSGSRNAYLAFASILTLAVAIKFLSWRRGAVASVVFAASVVLLPVASLQAGLGTVVLPQLEPQLKGRTWELSEKKQTFSLRSKLWRQAATEIYSNPATGIGPDIFQAQVGPRVMDRPGFNAHNLALQITVETGFIGLILAVAWAVALFSNRTPRSAASLPLTVLLLGQFLDCFINDPPTMVFAALLSGLLLCPGKRPE